MSSSLTDPVFVPVKFFREIVAVTKQKLPAKDVDQGPYPQVAILVRVEGIAHLFVKTI